LVGTGTTGPEGTHPAAKITKRNIEKIIREVFLFKFKFILNSFYGKICYVLFFRGCAIFFICSLPPHKKAGSLAVIILSENNNILDP